MNVEVNNNDCICYKNNQKLETHLSVEGVAIILGIYMTSGYFVQAFLFFFFSKHKPVRNV